MRVSLFLGVYSCILQVLSIFEQALRSNGVGFVTLNAGIKARQAATERFANDPETRVFLLNLSKAACGLNLINVHTSMHTPACTCRSHEGRTHACAGSMQATCTLMQACFSRMCTAMHAHLGNKCVFGGACRQSGDGVASHWSRRPDGPDQRDLRVEIHRARYHRVGREGTSRCTKGHTHREQQLNRADRGVGSRDTLTAV